MKKSRISVAIISTAAAVCGMLLGSSAALADEPVDPTPSSALVVAVGDDEIPEGAASVEAVLACDEFTGDVLAYAQKHGYCPTPSTLRTIDSVRTTARFVMRKRKMRLPIRGG